MANYRFKSATVEAHQSNPDTFEDVYIWAQRNGIASDKDDQSFKIVLNNETFFIRKDNTVWLMKLQGGDWLVISDHRFQQLFEAA